MSSVLIRPDGHRPVCMLGGYLTRAQLLPFPAKCRMSCFSHDHGVYQWPLVSIRPGRANLSYELRRTQSFIQRPSLHATMSYSLPPKPFPLKVDSANGKERPNFIIFMPDQLRFDSLGCTTEGSAGINTPNIDAFRRRGTLFTNCFTQASVCSQSRCSMFTGCYPHVSGHRSLENLIKPWEPNVFRSLKESGYHVACLAPRGDTFAPTVTELSVTEYGFLETPGYMPKFAGGGKMPKMLIKTAYGAGFFTRDCETLMKRSTMTKLWCAQL